MKKIAATIEDNDWSQIHAASHSAVYRPHISDRLRGHTAKFSLDALVNVASAVGQRAHAELELA